MAYNTNLYLMIFLPAVVVLYQLTPEKHRWKTLTLASVIYFLLLSKWLIAWSFVTTAVTWGGGIMVQRMLDANANQPKESRLKPKEMKKKTGRIVRLAVLVIVAILAGLKYTNFTMEIITKVMNDLGSGMTYRPLKILVPIGISFYTLQGVGYLLDVHWKRIEAEKNPFKVLLFMIFFPTLMEGPIMRWDDVKDSLFKGTSVTGDSIVQGSLRIGWGLFKRMLISDRMNTMVNILFDPKNKYNGLTILFTGFVVTVQLYMEFSGTIDIVIGSARIFGIKLPENFRQPFMAASAAEFWRRWHITLGVWFKNYIFYPVSTSGLMKKWNKFGRKHCGNYLTNLVVSAIALFPVWMLNGLWHGPKAPYILYGVYYFVILVIGVAIEPMERVLSAKLHGDYEKGWFLWFRRVRTFFVIITGETLFRCETWGQFTGMLGRLFTAPWHGNLFTAQIVEMGLDVGDLLVVLVALIIVFVVNYKWEKNPKLFEEIPTYSLPKRWSIYYFLIFSVIIFGAYGAGYQAVDLIYAGF